MEPFSQLLPPVVEALHRRLLPAPTPAPSASPSSSPPNWDGAWPRLDAASQARLRCPSCGGRRPAPDTPPEARCAACAGTGIACPTCCGRRWLRTAVPPQRVDLAPQLIVRCPDCATPAALAATVVAFVERALGGG